MTILITGGSGEIASMIRPLLAPTALRLFDLVPPAVPLQPGEEFLQGDIADIDAVTEASRGVELVVHLGGFRQERAFDELLQVNIGGTRAVLEGVRRSGVARVLLASSVHAVGYANAAQALNEKAVAPRPDSYYGVTKAAVEALGSLYADRFGMSIVSARIAAFLPRPLDRRGLSLWCSPADLVRLIRACQRLDAPGHHIVWGVSANSRRWVNAEAGASIGFHPQDDAQRFADGIQADGMAQEDLAEIRLGGDSVLLNRPLGTDWDPRSTAASSNG